MLVDSESINVKAWRRKESGLWEQQEYVNIAESLYLPAIRVSLELKEICEGISLAGEDIPSKKIPTILQSSK